MESSLFSAIERATYLNRLADEKFDLIIVGGGITGAGIALDAVSRGLKPLLLEKEDFAWGTSSRSTKLIHGGLRYLKQLEINLVREVGKERAIVHQNARHVVIPERMILPIIEGGSLGKFMSSLGLWVYDKLAGVEKEEQRQMLSPEEVLKEEPLVRTDILKGGGLYYEYRTDDARLCIEVIKKAVEMGAVCLNYTEVQSFLYDDQSQIHGVKFLDRMTNNSFQVKSQVVVNSTGPWVDKIRSFDEEVKGKRLHLTKGVHIVVNHDRLPVKQAVYFDVMEDNRMVFAIPRGKITYIGTTDTFYRENIDEPGVTLEDVDYVLKAANAMFPSVNLKPNDVRSSWSGLRPLIHEDGKDPSELSRKDEIFYSKNGLISIAGGKLTGYRKMAERIMDVVVSKLKTIDPIYHKLPKCQTKHLKLSGGDFESSDALKTYITQVIGESSQIQATPFQVESLVYKYGRNTDLIIGKAFEYYGDIQDPYYRLLKAEIWYGIHFESCHNLCDFVIRRTGRLYFERDQLGKDYLQMADFMADLLNWTEAEKELAIDKFKKEFEFVIQFLEPTNA